MPCSDGHAPAQHSLTGRGFEQQIHAEGPESPKVTPSQRNVDNSLVSPPQNNSLPPGAIAGAVLGPFALIAIGVIAIFYYKRKQQVNRLTIQPRIGRTVRPSPPDTTDKRLPTNASWSVVTPFDLTPQSEGTVDLEQPLLHNQSSNLAVALASTLHSSPQSSLRSSSPISPPPTTPASGSRPLPTPPDDAGHSRPPPPQYVGSGLDPVRKSPLPPSYTAAPRAAAPTNRISPSV